jgi:hypothetical protein
MVLATPRMISVFVAYARGRLTVDRHAQGERGIAVASSGGRENQKMLRNPRSSVVLRRLGVA